MRQDIKKNHKLFVIKAKNPFAQIYRAQVLDIELDPPPGCVPKT
jgi:hypothetical protein